MTLREQILETLRGTSPTQSFSGKSLGVIAYRLGVKRGAHGYSRRAYAKYDAIGAELQRMKRAGIVRFTRATRWRLA